jgi:glycosyltransferase involved in cell wall biosynthesis
VNSLKILHVGEYVKGGVATYIKEVVSYQRNARDIEEVYVMLSKNNSEKNFNIDPNNIIFYEYYRKPLYFIKAIIEVYRTIRKLEPDIIHAHSTFAGFFVRFPFLFVKKRPKIVYCSHGWSFLMDLPKYKKRLFALIERILSIKTDILINISYNELNNSVKYHLPKEKSIVIYNGISEVEKQGYVDIPIDESKINLLFVGRFDRQKGLDILLNFFSNYKNNNIRLYIIGDSVLNDQGIKIPGNVINLGWVKNEIIDLYYKKFDAIIMPSRWEGFGLVAIEAMKNKKPVIASNRGALPEIVKNGKNGFIFDLDNMETLQEILDRINKDILKKLGEEGYRDFKERFTSLRMNIEIIEQYKKLLQID